MQQTRRNSPGPPPPLDKSDNTGKTSQERCHQPWPWRMSKSFPGRQSRKGQPGREQLVHGWEGDSMGSGERSVTRAKDVAAHTEGEAREAPEAARKLSLQLNSRLPTEAGPSFPLVSSSAPHEVSRCWRTGMSPGKAGLDSPRG